jgi:hypothetical protein
MGDVLCSDARPGNPGGIFKRGEVFPLTLELSQSGTTVSGTIAFGQYRGNISGSVRSDQGLFLSGGASGRAGSAIITLTTTDWSTFLSGGRLEGAIGFGVRINTLPGDGVIRARLSNMIR